jgi:hypothetical protein
MESHICDHAQQVPHVPRSEVAGVSAERTFVWSTRREQKAGRFQAAAGENVTARENRDMLAVEGAAS